MVAIAINLMYDKIRGYIWYSINCIKENNNNNVAILVKTIPHKDTERACEMPKVFTNLFEEVFDIDPPPPPPSRIRVDNESNFSCRMDDIFSV